MRKAIRYLLSFRIEQILISLWPLLMGFFISGHERKARDYLAIASLAILFHLYGYGLNDVMDYPFDRENPKHRNRISLISMNYHRLRYLAFSSLMALLSVLLILNVYGFGKFMIYCLLSFISITIYNLFGKRSGRWTAVLHQFFPLSLTLILLGSYSSFSHSPEMPVQVILLAISFYLCNLLLNSYPGSLMDLRTDIEAGAGSFAAQLGCKVSGLSVKTSRLYRIQIRLVYGCTCLTLCVQGGINDLPVWSWLLMILFAFYGYAHLADYLNISDAGELQSHHPETAPTYLVAASTMAWAPFLPVVWWFLVPFLVLKPLVLRNPERLNRFTFVRLFSK